MQEQSFLDHLPSEIFEDDIELTLSEMSATCQLPVERIHEFIEEGIVIPKGKDPQQWRFQAISIRRIRCAHHLQRDLGVNVAGAALAIDLLEELERLQARLHRLEP